MATESHATTTEGTHEASQHLRAQVGAAPSQPDLAAANARIAALESKLMLAGTHLKNLAGENKQLAESLEKNAARRAELEKEIMAYRRQGESTKDQRTTTRTEETGGEVDALREQLSALQEELATTRSQKNDTQKAYAAEKQKAEDELSSYRTRIMELEKNANTAAKEAAEREASLREWATALEVKLNASAETASAAVGEGALRARIRQLEEELAETELTLEQLSALHQEELSQLVATYKTAHQEDAMMIRGQQLQSDKSAGKFRAELESAKEEIRRLNDTLDEAKRVGHGAEEIKNTLESLRKANIAAEAEFQEMKAMNGKLDAALASMSSENKEIRLMNGKLEAALAKMSSEKLHSLSNSHANEGKEKQRIAGADSQAMVNSQDSDLHSAVQPEAKGSENNIEVLEQTVREKSYRQIAAALDAILSKNVVSQDEWPETLREIFGRVQQAIDPDQREVEEKTQEAVRAACASLEAAHNDILSQCQKKLERITEDRNTLRDEHNALIGKVNAMKATLTPKFLADQEEAKLLRSHIAELTEQNHSLKEQLEAARTELDALRGESSKMNRELERLRAHLLEAHEASDQDALAREQAMTDLSARAEQAESELAKWKNIMAQQEAEIRMTDVRRSEIEAEYTTLKYDLEMARRENAELATNLQNLQSVLDEFEAAKESEIQSGLETLRRELEKKTRLCTFYQTKAEEAETELKRLEGEIPSAKQLQNEVREKNALIEKMRHEAIVLNNHLAEAMRRMKDETAEYSVDRRLITNLFVQYFNAPRADRKRWDILKLMSSMLQFTDEQNEQVGLKANAGNWIGPGSAGGVVGTPVRTQCQTPIIGAEESFTDKWISFLLSESSDRQSTNNSFTT